MKTTVDLPDPVFRQAKAAAAMRGVSLKQFITTAVEHSLHTTDGSLRDVILSLPSVPKETLDHVTKRVADADAADLDLQRGSDS